MKRIIAQMYSIHGSMFVNSFTTTHTRVWPAQVAYVRVNNYVCMCVKYALPRGCVSVANCKKITNLCAASVR